MTCRRRAVLGLLAGLALATPAAAQRRAPVTVFAAASLTNALQDVGKAYTARTGAPVRFSFASSAVIARQLEAGAAADLFVSADLDWMDYAHARGAIDAGSRRNLLHGRLALVAPVASRTTLKIRPGFPLAAALGARGRLALGDPDYVPAGKYAQAALTRLGVWDQVAGRIVKADNVRVALAYVARGEAPLGVVYETDARVEPKVRVVGVFPAGSHPPIVYPVALTRRAGPGARDFHAFLSGREARAIFQRYGFVTP